MTEVLGMIDVLPQATRVLVSGFDRYSQSQPGASTPGASWIFTVAELEKAGALLATGMNGVPLGLDHGFPIRLMVPNWYGCACIKWVDAITLVDDDAPATSQMREFASRTHQDGVPALARDYKPATMDQAAMPGTDREMAGRGQDCLSRRRDHVGRLSRHGQALDPLRIGSAVRARRRVPEAEHEPGVDDLVARLASHRGRLLCDCSQDRRSVDPGQAPRRPASTNGRSTSPRSEYRVPYGHRLVRTCVWRRPSASRQSQADWDGSPFRPRGRQRPRSTSNAAFSSSTASNTGRPESSFSLLRKWHRLLRWPIGAKP